MLKVILQCPAPSTDFVLENIVNCGFALALHVFDGLITLHYYFHYF